MGFFGTEFNKYSPFFEKHPQRDMVLTGKNFDQQSRGVGRRVGSAVAKPRRGNPDTDVYRNLSTVAYSSTLLC
jgi:hypothetical protein